MRWESARDASGAWLTRTVQHTVPWFSGQCYSWVPGTYVTLGTDGFGFSDTRPAARRVFNVDAESIVVATLSALAASGEIDKSKAVEAAEKYKIDDVTAAPTSYADTGSA